ncbi:TRAP transporter substrate-binding protein [Desulfoscipio geothermicus]|uniref:TRAP-type C4-dicarboxylate transport system, substrate-binding protein n=1 Tax=Desulfoscipio geothermicus DSM 3669 TaxID=1121426 RepID=A0A1I6E643_9FIRM|nr:TRAP transporter substrate-binding protein [Desulfoscipio geothermicus]SFR13214.1 TRAP-type C4-dicarboxylate transport system, substrate-binding protein [Desulfoscipio geothermicus DSM 3669]
MNLFKKSSIVTIVVSLFILSLLAGCGGGGAPADDAKSAEPVNWTANSVWPPENHQSAGLQEFANKVKEATNGQVEITVQTGGALGFKGPELLKVVRDGLVPVSDILTSGVAGDEPVFGVVTLPFLIQNFEEGKILNEIARPYFDKVAEEKWNQKILYISPWPAAGIWSKEKIESVEDMRGLKTRTYDKNGALVMEAVGGTPYPLPFSEVYSSLATGVIDSVLTSTPTAVDAKFWEVLKYYAPINVTMATDLVTVNLDEFNKLDEETREALIAAGKEMEEEMWAKVAELDKQKEAECNENGIETVQPSQEFLNELSSITKDIREEWLKQAPPEAKEIVSEFLKQVGRQ